jgi:hypothetical protein
MSLDKNRKHFIFQKDKGHPHESEKYLKVMKHILELFKKESLKEGAYGIASLTNSWKNSETEFYLYPGSDFDDKEYDMFCKLVEEYPWGEFGISKPYLKE